MSIILLLGLFNAAHCNIYIDIALSNENQSAKVSVNGCDRDLITNEEQKSFCLTPDDITNHMNRIGLSPPTHIYVQKTSQFGHRDIFTILKPLTATITNFTKKPVVLSNKTFINHGETPEKYKMGIHEERLERMTVRWNTEKELSLGREIMIHFADRKVFRSAWNKGETKLWDSKMASRSDVEFSLASGENATVVTTAMRAQIQLKIDYVAILDGDLYFLRRICFIPIKEKAMDVNQYFYVIGALGLVSGYQTIILDFYFAGQVNVQDGNGKMIMDPVPFH